MIAAAEKLVILAERIATKSGGFGKPDLLARLAAGAVKA